MGVFAKLRAGISVGQSSGSIDNGESTGGTQQPLKEIPQLATYLVPGSAAVQVSDSSIVTVASLEPGQKILGMDMGTGNNFIWATLQQIEPLPINTQFQHKVIVGLEGHDSAELKPDDVILTKDRNKKAVMQPVCQLHIGVKSVVMFDAHGLRWTGKIAEEVKKINSLQTQLVRDKDRTEGLYELTMESTSHALLVSYTQDSNFLVVKCSNSPALLTSLDQCSSTVGTVSETSEQFKTEIKNPFMNAGQESQKEIHEQMLGGTPESRSETDNHSEGSSMSENSTIQIRVGTNTTTNEDGFLISKGTGLIRLSEYTKLPINDKGVRLSGASATHKPGRKSRCRKCAFYNIFARNKGKTCKFGALCDFCHEDHERFIHRVK